MAAEDVGGAEAGDADREVDLVGGHAGSVIEVVGAGRVVIAYTDRDGTLAVASAWFLLRVYAETLADGT